MTDVRFAKIDGIAEHCPEQGVEISDPGGALAVVGWRSTYGPIYQAMRWARGEGLDVSHIHLRHIWPLPRNRGELLGRFQKSMAPKMSRGKPVILLRSEYLVPAEKLAEVTGQPFKVAGIEAAIHERLEN